MQPAQPPVHRSHTAIWLGVLALLVIASTLIGGCKKEPGPQPGVPSPSPSPQASPTGPGGTPTEVLGDTPIVVKGGGSIDLEFNETIFPGTSTAVCANCKIKSVTLEQIKDTGQPIPTTPEPKICQFQGEYPEIRIRTKNNANDITVVGKNNGTVEIGFGNKYPGVISECGDERKHHSNLGEIKGVSINQNPDDCEGCGNNPKRCKIVVTVGYTMKK